MTRQPFFTLQLAKTRKRGDAAAPAACEQATALDATVTNASCPPSCKPSPRHVPGDIRECANDVVSHREV